jgi:site-specific DNA-cytosine methylase
MQQYGRDFSPRRSKELVPRTDGKCNCLTTALTKEHIVLDESFNFRKLTPIECERLQTVPDNYTEGVSNTQRYKMLGNGWTVDVIAHILSYI